jgi:hypothetical protein
MRVEKLHILLEFITIIKHCVLFGSRNSPSRQKQQHVTNVHPSMAANIESKQGPM